MPKYFHFFYLGGGQDKLDLGTQESLALEPNQYLLRGPLLIS